jgi:hypothetical protein
LFAQGWVLRGALLGEFRLTGSRSGTNAVVGLQAPHKLDSAATFHKIAVEI